MSDTRQCLEVNQNQLNQNVGNCSEIFLDLSLKYPVVTVNYVCYALLYLDNVIDLQHELFLPLDCFS